jgi:predicted PurR-regulated permease PerM
LCGYWKGPGFRVDKDHMNRWAAWIAAFLALVFLYLIRSILAPFVIASILAYVLVPGVEALAERLRVRRSIIVLVLYGLLALSLGVIFLWLEPSLMFEVRSLRQDSVQVVHSAIVQLVGTEDFELLGNMYQAGPLAKDVVAQVRETFNSPTSAFQFAQALFQGLAEFALTLVALFYLLLDWESLVALVFRFVPSSERPRVRELARSVHNILGQYLRGQLILIAVMALVTWIALQFFFHLPFAFAIAISTGFLEVIPLVGPVVAAAVAAVAALSRGGLALAFQVILFYTVLRQIEDQLVAPNVLGRAVHVHPLAAIFAVLAGGVLAGPLGLILGVPAAAAVNVVLDALQPPVKLEQPSSGPEK